MNQESQIQYLIERLTPKLNARHIADVNRAYKVAADAHSGQKRDEGTPYIVHAVFLSV